MQKQKNGHTGLLPNVTVIPFFPLEDVWIMVFELSLIRFAFSTVGFFGAPGGIRTPDTLLKRQVLCRLSYWGIKLAGTAGLEPTIRESKSRVLPLHHIPPSVFPCCRRVRSREGKNMGWEMGLEPTASGTTIRRSTN
jgi:hypothetical protein